MSQSKNKRKLITLINPRSPIAESYRNLRTNLDFSSIDQKLQVLMVTSAGPGEGKSTTLANLAVTYAQSERRVLLIDADMRKPTAHHTFNVSNRFGLTAVLSNQIDYREAVQFSEEAGFDVLSAGKIPPNPAEMLASKRMEKLLEDLRKEYDMILIDTPPLLAVTDAQIVSSRSDGALMVIDQGKVKREIASKALKQLENVKARILGVVLNNVKRNSSEEYYYYYYGNNA